MTIEGIHVESIDTADDRLNRVRVTGAGAPVELSVSSSHALVQDLTPWAALLAPAAMALARPLHLHGSVDAASLRGLTPAQDTLTGWFPEAVSRIDVRADETTERTTRSSDVALLFSGGVDAFHSALLHRERITHLLFVHGFDIPLWRSTLRAEVARRLTDVADELEVELVQVETDVKPWMDQFVRWGEIYHGAATAGVAIAHPDHVGTALIASSAADEDLAPWGSHPDLDPLWSSSGVTIVHDARKHDRMAKVRSIVDWDLAMKHLRVCWMNPDEVYNCGDCEKCVRTMVNLYIADGLERCETLPGRLDPKRLRRPALNAEERRQIAANLAALRTGGRPDPEVEAALRTALRRGALLQPVDQFVVDPARRARRTLASAVGRREPS